MSEPTEFIVDGDVPVAVVDYGGDGPAIMLLHGGGGHLGHWEDLAPLLVDEFRVVAVDLRGHGRSGDGPMRIDGFLADLAAVRDHCGLDRFAVVGHSLGGMIAAHWASDESGPAAVISIDGHRPAETDPQHYRGVPEDVLTERLAALGAVFDAQAQALDAPVPDEIASVLGGRAIVERDGRWRSRFTYALATELRDQDWFRDSVPAIGRTRVPLLVLLATKNPPGMPEIFTEVMDAYRRGLRDDLSAVSETNPCVMVAEIDAGHGMVTEAPGAIAAVIAKFVGDAL